MEAHVLTETEAEYVTDLFRGVMDALSIPQGDSDEHVLSTSHALMALSKAAGFILCSMPANVRPNILATFKRQLVIDTDMGVKARDGLAAQFQPKLIKPGDLQ